MLIFNRCISGLMTNLIKTSWTVSKCLCTVGPNLGLGKEVNFRLRDIGKVVQKNSVLDICHKMTKHCSSGKCNSDERYHPNKKFAKFVQPKGHHPDLKRCQRWVHLMGRLDLSVEHINRTKYVCEDHFNEGVDLDYRKVILFFFTFLKV